VQVCVAGQLLQHEVGHIGTRDCRDNGVSPNVFPALKKEGADVRYGSLADITANMRDVHFTPPIADIRRCRWDVREVPTADGYPTSSRRIRGTIHDL
jgi:hypothetical protein